jgi:serine/threonine protein kinase
MLRGCWRARILNSSKRIPSNPSQMHVIACDHCGAASGAGSQFCAECGAELVGSTPGERRQVEALRLATAGHYDIRGELGRGGMATVYLAHDLALDRKVAIKVMSPALAMGDGIERFKREARTAASLSHPNIIPVFGVHHTEELLYFVMKYVQGRPLDGIIRELGALPIPMVQAILGQVASAFGYAHRHGVIHRDIKPANILIDDEGWAVVTDFGIAKVSDSKGLTMTGLSVGTPTYMSPEQVAGDGVTPASDQYALGVLAYEMLTGKPPFQGANSMAMMYAHVHHPPPPLEAARPDCPEGLRDAVMRMLAKEPAERWPSVEDAIVAIGTPPPLNHDDPTRSQLIELARTGANERLAGIPRTPKSPIPLGRTPAPRQRQSIAMRVRHGASPLSIGIAAAGVLVAAGSLVVALRGRGEQPPAESAAVAAPAESTAIVSAPAVELVPASATSTTETPPPVVESAPAELKPVAAKAPAVRERIRAEAPPSPGAAAESVAPPPPPPPTTAAAPAPVPVASAAAPKPATVSGASALLGGGASASGSVAATRKPGSAADKGGIERAIAAYSSALQSRSAAEVRRAFPGIPEAQHAYLASLFGAGGRMQPKWKTSDIVVRGDTGTVVVRGTTRVMAGGGNPYDETVDARVTLERMDGEWRIRSFMSR